MNQHTKLPARQFTLVIKIGTSVLTTGTQALNRAHMVELSRQCAQLKSSGHRVVLVSSGAIAAGREHLKFPHLNNSMANKQLLAAVGQSQLIHTWETLFGLYDIKIGQMLLTRADLKDRERFLNARDTVHALLAHNIIPIINENDAVATSEIKVGDNDNLSALAAILCGADKLLMLTDQQGLYSCDPNTNPDAQLIKRVNDIDDDLMKIATGSNSTLGTGGMTTKLQAANIATRAGIEVFITSGLSSNAILDSLNSDANCTTISASDNALENRKKWILAGPTASGELTIDDGALTAITQNGSSLLAKGITRVSGTFNRGEVVRIKSLQGTLIARGLISYSSDDLTKIIGHHSNEIHDILGYDYGSEALHRDDLVIF
ncbi:glutamate 5-kinase [Shewanella sp. 202IG2-18]|uniref:glutamate 5-kinase n=1 Tax=Parashewanella hymeniacidonis TaxID=2807618 RepID=UPI001961E9BE|nr:glutamate 5-kinase [Parashewanella hymeniacidonis]MBM7072576.1 glutamate 5-kinase [Parashewanella hymeniacidonis]